jgi:quercetin dioxygenase-like cupin family protein
MPNSGTEYGHLISGKLELNLGFDTYLLAAGDSVCFASTKPHGYRNDGAIPAVGVWFVVEPS